MVGFTQTKAPLYSMTPALSEIIRVTILVVAYMQRRRKDFLIGGAQYVINYFVVQNIIIIWNRLKTWGGGGHVPPVLPPGSYAYDMLQEVF